MRVFLSWWFSQLAGLLPGFLVNGSAKRADAVILDVGVDVVTLLIRAQGRVTSIAQASPDEPGLRDLSHALHAEKSFPRLVLLRLPASWILRKHLSFPAAARRDLKNLLGFEIDRETPFAREEIYWSHALLHQDTARGRLDVELFLIPRRSADPFIEIVRRVGLEPAAVEIDAGAAGVNLVSLKNDNSATEGRPGWPLIPRAVAAGAFAVVAAVAPFLYQEWAIASADATIASLQVQADEAASLRQAADRIARTGDFFNKGERRGNGLATLAAVTRSLPDDSYLTGLTLRGNRLTISGLSPSAAQLVGVFAHSPLFREPSFDSPVVGNGDGDLERFTISVSLAQAGSP